MTADVTREEDCARVMEAALSHFGRLDILVNNAGRGMKYVSERFLTAPTRFWEVRPDVFRMLCASRGQLHIWRRFASAFWPSSQFRLEPLLRRGHGVP
jgi:NAD(P)-dependent dehydrogenase (short-subunit alcohol dehydrogenase family)